MTNNGFFGWIRQGVKQSVLLGVSDALDALGTVDSNESFHPSIAKAIGTGAMGGSAGIFHPSGISVEATPEIPWKTNADLPPRYIGIFPALKEKTANTQLGTLARRGRFLLPNQCCDGC
jgi:hypothetical protein